MSGYVTKLELENILMNRDNRLRAIKGKTPIEWLDTPVNIAPGMTWDDAWHTYDLTSITSANAKGVILGIYLERTTGSNYTGYLYTAKYNNTAWEGIVYLYSDSANGFKIGGNISQGIDNQQRMNYCGCSAAGAKIVKVLGYWE